MPSVENFYWVLYENLLKPLSMSCVFYYPFGTQDHLLYHEFFKQYRLCHMHHVLFHFDQEPLWNDDLGLPYEVQDFAFAKKLLRILANSERSAIKSEILPDRQMLDWYFFYHGFAALDWFRDTEYIHDDPPVTSAFLSLNHVLTTPRHYRLDLVARLIEAGIQNKGRISLHCTQDHIDQALRDPFTKLGDISKQRIRIHLDHRIKLPWMVDHVPIDGNLSARAGHKELALWQSCLLHVVNETVFYHPKLHLTEKTFKPIVSKRPFVLVAAPGNLAYLRSYGFQTFDKWIDETYDSIEDDDMRLAAITEQIAKISALSPAQIQDLQQDMQSVLDFNKRHFFTDFRRIIVHELVDNFETCVRIWNNGRVDGREIPFVVDSIEVKKTLLA